MKNIVVVTGASSGMGLEFARQIIHKEKIDELWLIARREEKLNEIAKSFDKPVKVLPLDLSKDESQQVYQDMLWQEKPNIVILANCAGYGKLNHYENIDHDTHMNMIDLNVRAVVSMVDASLPYMRAHAKIMNIASCAGYLPVPYANIYAATKAFVIQYSRALNQELKYRRIHVLAVCPYWVETEFFNRAVIDHDKEVVKNYTVIYPAHKVIQRAIRDLYSKKDVSLYGVINKAQVFATRIVPMKVVMKVWLMMQQLDGTKDIRE